MGSGGGRGGSVLPPAPGQEPCTLSLASRTAPLCFSPSLVPGAQETLEPARDVEEDKMPPGHGLSMEYILISY